MINRYLKEEELLNGPEYIGKNLQKRLKESNINDCHTPTYPPQSNGMCEALNGTFNRDYAFESCIDNQNRVLSQIQGWVDDFNNFAPHSALKMKTPKEYFIKNRARKFLNNRRIETRSMNLT